MTEGIPSWPSCHVPPTVPGLASRALQYSPAGEEHFLGSISSHCHWHRLRLHLGIHTVEGGWCIPRKECAGKESIRAECQDSASVESLYLQIPSPWPHWLAMHGFKHHPRVLELDLSCYVAFFPLPVCLQIRAYGSLLNVSLMDYFKRIKWIWKAAYTELNCPCSPGCRRQEAALSQGQSSAAKKPWRGATPKLHS